MTLLGFLLTISHAIPDPPPLLCFMSDIGPPEICVDMMLECDTALDFGGGDPDVYSTNAGPGFMVTAFTVNDGITIIQAKPYVLRSWEGFGRRVNIVVDDDAIFFDGTERPECWSAFSCE